MKRLLRSPLLKSSIRSYISAPSSVRIVEVGPRDGLQNEARAMPTECKVQFIEKLSDAGLSIIESGAFVSREWVPQMADSGAVLSKISRKENVSYCVLTPNLKGLELALESKADEVSIFTAASETFTRKNTNCSVEESLQRFELVMERAKQVPIKVRAYISCAFECPYEGRVAPKQVIELAQKLLSMGCYEVSISDTIGVATPGTVHSFLEDAISSGISPSSIGVHFHDTYGQALSNILVSLDHQVRSVDCSVAGLGGCPYAGGGATGNVATEDVVYMLNGLGVETGVDLEKVVEAGEYVTAVLGRPSSSKTGIAMMNKKRQERW